MKKQLLLSLIFSIIYLALSAQCNVPPPGKSCATAPIICPLDGYCSSTGAPNAIDQSNTFCGSIQNNQWLGFIANSTDLTIEIVVGDCNGTGSGTGIQAQVLLQCGAPWTTVGGCLYEISPNSMDELVLNNLTIGDTYYLMIDGFSGDICNYTINVTSGATASGGATMQADAGADVVIDCISNQVTLDASNSVIPANSSISWINISGDILSTDLIFNTTEIGEYFFVITEDATGCNSIDQVEVIADAFISLELGGTIYLGCNGPTVIEGDTIPLNPDYSYSWTTTNGNILSGADTPTPSIDAIGTYLLTMTDNVSQCVISDEIIVINFEDAFIVAPEFNVDCFDGGTIQLDVVTLVVNNSNYSYLWTTADGDISFGQNNKSPFISSIGTYQVLLTDPSSGCSSTGVVNVIDTTSVATIAQIDSIGNLNCYNTSMTLDGSNSSSQNNLNYNWMDENNVLISLDAVIDIFQPGLYTLTVFDELTGCSDSEQILITADSNVPVVSMTSNEIELNCGNNFTSEVAGILLSVDPVSYEWTGPDNFSSVDSNVIISGNVEGIYELTTTNLTNGCSITHQVLVTNNGFEININTNSATCDMQDGMASISTGLANPGFEWSTGETTNSISNLGQGWYSVTVTDLDNNCGKHQNFYVDEDISCKIIISGYVVDDPNSTCTYDASLEGIECVMVKIEPLGFYTLTDATGYYEFIVDAGSYTVEYIGSSSVELACPMPGTYNVTLNTNGTSSEDNHFFVFRKDFDLCITKFTGNARPGFSQFNCIQICNYSDEAQDAIASFNHDSLFAEITPLPDISPININAVDYVYDESTYTFTWNLTDLAPGECRKIMWYMEVPLTAQLGDGLTSTAKVNPIVGDENPSNNCLTWLQAVTNAYDPNDKRNFVGETQWGGAIYENDTTMQYAIRFQNVGNDTAFTVVVRDTLDDAHLDVTSIRGFTSSHDMQVQFEKSNILVFTFENIMLVDSATNEPASNGWLNFDIDRKSDLPFGTEITNQAAIYFDFNEPVITNELVNILTNSVSIFSPIKNTLDIEITPTVTSDEIRINYVLEKTTPVSVQIYNVGGMQLQHMNFGKKETGEHVEHLSLKDFTAGVYFILVKTEEGSAVRKVIKM